MLNLKQDNERLQRIVTSKSLASSQSSLQTHDSIDRRYSTTDVPSDRSGERNASYENFSGVEISIRDDRRGVIWIIFDMNSTTFMTIKNFQFFVSYFSSFLKFFQFLPNALMVHIFEPIFKNFS